jgi:hypothetical protein
LPLSESFFSLCSQSIQADGTRQRELPPIKTTSKQDRTSFNIFALYHENNEKSGLWRNQNVCKQFSAGEEAFFVMFGHEGFHYSRPKDKIRQNVST